jgi:hypothetical protein
MREAILAVLLGVASVLVAVGVGVLVNTGAALIVAGAQLAGWSLLVVRET